MAKKKKLHGTEIFFSFKNTGEMADFLCLLEESEKLGDFIDEHQVKIGMREDIYHLVKQVHDVKCADKKDREEGDEDI